MEYGSRGFYVRGRLSSDIRARGEKADFAPNILNLLNQHSLSEGRETGFSFQDINTHIPGLPWRLQWLGRGASTAGDLGSIPNWGTKILQATQCSQKYINR